jgi:hypothetical protein
MGNASVVVSTSAGSSLPTTVNVVAQAPGIFYVYRQPVRGPESGLLAQRPQ